MENISESKLERGWNDMVEGRVVPIDQVFDEIETRHAHDKISHSLHYAS